MIDRIALFLAIVGGLNWGLVGIFGFDLVAFLSEVRVRLFQESFTLLSLFRQSGAYRSFSRATSLWKADRVSAA